MNLTIFHIILLLKVVSARYAFVPRFFGQDSAIIVDTDKAPGNTKQSQKSRLLHYPVYHIVPSRLPPPSDNGQIISKELPKIEEPNIATQSAIFTNDEFPKDLLDIAQNKLGINNLDEIPSISELGELLGTESALETIKYIREITATEEGIALVKAYIEASDYTDSTGITTISTTTDYSTSTNIEYDATDLDAAIKPSFFERLSAYFNIFDFFLASKEPTDLEKNSIESSTTQKALHKPLLVRHPLPYHYPIPIRPVVIYKPRNAAPTVHNGFRPVAHLNTPKYFRQPVKTSSKPAPKLQKSEKQQQLTMLAENVSKFPLAHDRTALIDAEYIAAIEKAIEQDEDLKKIIGSTGTLK